MSDTYETPPQGWTCFHCGETFKQERQARWHFGATATAKPGCMLRVDPIEERGFLKLFRREEERATALEAENAALKAENARLRERGAEAGRALDPFADVGAWLFARDLPDDTPMVELRGINDSAGALTRGHFKAAHTARALLQGGPDA